MSVSAAIHEAARPFVRDALPLLAEMNLYPRPRANPFIRIGTDYFGGHPALPGFAELAAAVKSAHPRFSDDEKLVNRDFAEPYVYSFLEACVAGLSGAADPWDVEGDPVGRTIRELIARVTEDECRIAACRVVSHVTTVDGEAHRLGDILVVPLREEAAEHRREVLRRMQAAIPGAGEVFRDLAGAPWGPPESVLIAESTTTAPFEDVAQLTRSIDDFLLTCRLLQGTTAQSAYEVTGESTIVCLLPPRFVPFTGHVGVMSQTQMVRRDLVVSTKDEKAIDGLHALLGQAHVERPNIVIDPLALAIHRFTMSHYARSPYDQVIDLATALEAAVSGKTATDVLMRLRTRCACLLTTDNDPASAIFDDVGILYDLRSRLVHGGETKVGKLIGMLNKLSRMPADAPFGEALCHAVDRLRDLVRRSILVRICLGTGDDALWPFTATDSQVDSALTDDVTRECWRTTWHGVLDGIGASGAWNRPSPAQSYLHTFSDSII